MGIYVEKQKEPFYFEFVVKKKKKSIGLLFASPPEPVIIPV